MTRCTCGNCPSLVPSRVNALSSLELRLRDACERAMDDGHGARAEGYRRQAAAVKREAAEWRSLENGSGGVRGFLYALVVLMCAVAVLARVVGDGVVVSVAIGVALVLPAVGCGLGEVADCRRPRSWTKEFAVRR